MYQCFFMLNICCLKFVNDTLEKISKNLGETNFLQKIVKLLKP